MHTIDTPVLLRDAFAARSEPVSNDFQVRFGRPNVGHPSATPCVVVATRAADAEADHLSLQLAAEGVPVLRLDADRAAGSELTVDPATATVLADGQRFIPRVLWSRYFAPAAVAGGGTAHGEYVRSQWAPAVEAVAASGCMRVVNPAAAPGRVAQLAAAAHTGLRVPATVVTTRPAAAARGIPGEGDVVVKALGDHHIEHEPGRLSGLRPRRVSRADLTETEAAPVLVQEHVHADGELRVFVAGRELVAFRVRKPSPDSEWTDPGSVAVEPAGLPDQLASKLARLAGRWRLDVAAFDLLDAPGGPVFLEVNAACDWRWYERLAGSTQVSDAVAAFVQHAYRRQGVYGRRP